MKRIEKALLHNPDLCPFGLVAQGEKIEEGEVRLELTQEIALFSHPDNPHLAYQRQSKLMRDAFEKEKSISF